MTALNASPDPRAQARAAFIDAAGWSGARIDAFPGDASTRSYFRLVRPQGSAVLMDAPGGAEAPACPAGASEAERRALGYNALARLAGPNTAAFAGLAEALCARGFSAPRILSADIDAGLLLLEDLGDALFARVIPEGAEEAQLYETAVDALAALYRSSFPEDMRTRNHSWRVQAYDEVAMIAEAELLLDWWLPHQTGAGVDDGARRAWRAAWSEALEAMRAHPPGLVLRDYHAENLIWMPDRDAEARVGLLDFQDALFGHPAYDLVSLIEDARRDVDPALAAPLKARFVEQAGLADHAGFDAAYAVIGAQRNAKILGIFVRLAKRDGKPRYLDLLTRVEGHFRNDLAHPALGPVRSWFDGHTGLFREAGT